MNRKQNKQELREVIDQINQILLTRIVRPTGVLFLVTSEDIDLEIRYQALLEKRLELLNY